MNDIIDLHTHTIACGHAYNTLYEMIRAGADAGMKLFGSSDHGPLTPGSCHKFYFTNFKAIPRELFGIHVLMGCEVNILDYEGHVDLEESLLTKLDYAIASLHLPTCAPGTASQNTDAYVKVMENPLVQIIGHPDDSRYPIDYDTLVAAAKEHHMILEVNSSSFHPLSSRAGAREHYLTMLERCVHYQVPILMGSDAHSAANAGNHSRARQLLEELRFPEELILNTSIEKLFPYIPVLKTVMEGQMLS